MGPPAKCRSQTLLPGITKCPRARGIVAFDPSARLGAEKSYAFRRFTLTHLGRSEVLLIGTLCPESGGISLTVTASTLRPVQLRFKNVPSAEMLELAVDAATPFELYLDDAHGSPHHRQHLTYYFAEQIRQQLSN